MQAAGSSGRRAEGAGTLNDAPAEPLESEEIWTVSRLISQLNLILDMEFSSIKVVGEVSGVNIPRSGHAYFTLKDDQGQLSAVMFRAKASKAAELIKEGSAILCSGSLNVYRARGTLQLVVDGIRAWGEGALKAAFEELKRRLLKEGLFDQETKKRLPFHPRRIFVITSPTGAAFRDFLKAAAQGVAPEQIILCPSLVQGQEAPEQLINALDLAESQAEPEDVIVLTRGGGSLEDLWAFNHEALARRIHACRIPVVSAVGHEVDFTIADFVADVRAPTPTAAAHLVLPPRQELKAELAKLVSRAESAFSDLLLRKRHRLRLLEAGLRDPRHALTEGRLRLDELSGRLAAAAAAAVGAKATLLERLRAALFLSSPGSRLADLRQGLHRLLHRQEMALSRTMHEKALLLSDAASRLQAASPLSCLERGFSIVYRLPPGRKHKRKEVVSSAHQVSTGDLLEVRPREGRLLCRVEERSFEEDSRDEESVSVPATQRDEG